MKNRFKLLIILFLIILLTFLNADRIGYLLLIIIIILTLTCIKEKDIIFLIFGMTTLAMGANLNLKYKFGSIVLSDVILFLYLISGFLKKEKNKKNNIFYFEFFLVLILSIYGLLMNYSFYNIFQDIKFAIYLFTSINFFMNKSINENKKFYIEFTYMMSFCVIAVFFQEIFTLFENGINTLLTTSFSVRNVSINVQVVSIVSAWLILLKDTFSISKKYNIFIQIIGFIAVVCSFTRTIWIAYALTMILLFIFAENTKKNFLKRIIYFFTVVLIIFLSVKYGTGILGEFINIIKTRLNGIFEYSSSNVNTFYARTLSTNYLFNNKILSPTIFIGRGLGDVGIIFGTTNGVFCENSIIYFLWKYGLIITLYWILKFGENIFFSLKSKKRVRLLYVTIIVYVVIANMSGNLNYYYLTILTSLAWNFKNIFYNYT